jgi:hypothetical protein
MRQQIKKQKPIWVAKIRRLISLSFPCLLMLRMRAPFNRKKFKGIAAGNGSTRFQFRVAFELLCLGVGIL